MLINNKKNRLSFLFVITLAVITILIFRLAQLQIVQGYKYKELAQNKMVQKITEKATRGSIFTSDGYEIAKNRIGYSVELTYNKSKDEQQNEVLLRLYEILEKNGEKIEDSFPILLEDNELVFSYEKDEANWKEEQKIPAESTAMEALQILRERFKVKKEVSNEVALKSIEKVHMNSNLPIMIKDGNVLFVYENSELEWKKDYGFVEKEYSFSAKESFLKLRNIYKINNNMNNEQARKIIVFQQLLKEQGFRSWDPIVISNNLKLDTVFEIDSNIHELLGVSISASPVREYPFKTLASHVLGYIGKVNDKDVEEEQYKMNDLKGISGIEAVFEDVLKGKDGERFAVTDYKGRPQNDPIKDEVRPIPGDNVVLTVDYDLQKVAEEALEKQIKEIQKGKAPKAKSGAVVVLDVNTGAVLALASYPDYDPNLFTNGINTEDWNKLNVLVDDPLFPKPLYNNATMTALQPGSVFKPLVAAAALQEGVITKTSTIFCPGYFPPYPNFTCLSAHGVETVREALKDSCNVFFYETGSRLGVDIIEKYAKEFGLGSKTGIEITESSGYLATKQDKSKTWTYRASDYIRNTVGVEGTKVIINDEGKEQEVYKSYAMAKNLFANVSSDNLPSSYEDVYKEVSNTMSQYNIKDSKYLHQITQHVLSGRWVNTDTINASIGQGGNSFTPLQIANYLATLVNGGIRRETYLVEKVVTQNGDMTYKHQEKILNKININEEYIQEIKKGMKDVAMYSSGRSAFLGFDHSRIGVGGKTGTAQYGSKDIDNTGWFMAFAPYEKPEIAVVSMIIQGKTSANSVPIVKDVMDAYFYKNHTYEEVKNQVD